MKWKGILFIISIFVLSCSNLLKLGRSNKRYSEQKFSFTDKSGQFSMIRTSGLTKSNEFVTKEKILPHKGWDGLPLEKAVLISSFGKWSNNISIIRPKISQRTYWFNKKKYFSEVKLTEKKNGLRLKWKGPGDLEFKTKNHDLPKMKRLYCFIGQLIECINETGFFYKSMKEKVGSVFLTIIFDGYPYFNKQYQGLGEEVFAQGEFVFDDKIGGNLFRYALNFKDHSITYFVDKNGNFVDKFWISQGLSVRNLSLERSI